MASRPFVVAWRHSAAELGARSRAERDAQLARRWQTLWLLRGGKPMREAAALVGVAYRTAQEWVAWYRAGGLEEVGRHRRGGLRRTIVRPVTPEQEAALARRAVTTGFAPHQQALRTHLDPLRLYTVQFHARLYGVLDEPAVLR